MARKKVFYTKKAPEPKGPYSQAVIHSGLLYISGQIPVDPESGELLRATIEEETETVLNNIKIIVEEAGANMDRVLKVTCYLADIDDFPREALMLIADKNRLQLGLQVDWLIWLPRAGWVRLRLTPVCPNILFATSKKKFANSLLCSKFKKTSTGYHFRQR